MLMSFCKPRVFKFLYIVFKCQKVISTIRWIASKLWKSCSLPSLMKQLFSLLSMNLKCFIQSAAEVDSSCCPTCPPLTCLLGLPCSRKHEIRNLAWSRHRQTLVHGNILPEILFSFSLSSKEFQRDILWKSYLSILLSSSGSKVFS